MAAEGSIAAAGRMLQYTRSAVSQQLTALETEAGTAQVNRAGNRVTLTPAGRILVDHADRILVELRAAEATLARHASVRLTVLVFHRYACLLVPDLVVRLYWNPCAQRG